MPVAGSGTARALQWHSPCSDRTQSTRMRVQANMSAGCAHGRCCVSSCGCGCGWPWLRLWLWLRLRLRVAMAAAVAVAVGLCCHVVASSLLSSRRPTWQCEWEPATRIAFRHATDIYVHVHTAPSTPARTGNTGEGYILDVAERRTLTEVCVDECSKASKCSIIHVGHPDTPTALALGVHAKEAGADAISSMPPFQVRVCTLKHACTAMPACASCLLSHDVST